MKLYLMQHAEAVPSAEDPARPLSARGRRQAEITAPLDGDLVVQLGVLGRDRGRQGLQPLDIAPDRLRGIRPTM